MTEALYQTVPVWLGIFAFACVLRLCRQHVLFSPILLAACIQVLGTAILIYGIDYQDLLIANLSWNWAGKVGSLIFGLAVVAILPQLTRERVGLVWRQRPGSLLPALVGMAVLWLMALGVSAQLTAHLQANTLFFEATMPGLAEELMFRGILLALLFQALADRTTVFGATLGSPVLIISIVFGLVHGFSHDHSGYHFSPEETFSGGVVGFALAWLRQRTDSLVLPVVAHNGFNVILEAMPAVWGVGP